MLRDQIKKDIKRQVSRLVGKRDGLPARLDSAERAGKAGGVEVTRTTDPKFGDYSSNIALQLGPKIKRSPLEFAKVLADSFKDLPYVLKLEVAGPGFINFFIKPAVWQKEVENVLKVGNRYGSNQIGRGKKARIEFVSANPTGPLHFGNARGGPIGDVLASVLEFSGYKVTREYYHNDVGEQVRKLGDSIVNVAAGLKLEDQEYKGEYVRELAKKAVLELSKGQRISSTDAGRLGEFAVETLLSEIINDCKAMGIEFDEVYKESEIANSGDTKADIDHLREKGVIKEKEGALWFTPNDEFLKDRETVVVKSDGNYTYFANDIAYHNLKFEDSPDLVVDVFGANHHGHVPRLQAVIKALDYDVSKFHVILYQWVRFKHGSEQVAMSKRSGTFVTAREVLDEVGCDVVRFFILMHDPNSHIDFDLELAKKKSAENPVYYVQYAHARIASILAKLETRNSKLETNYGLLTTNYELDLIKQITRLGELVEDIAGNFAVHRLTSYATELADSFHKFYENCRVIGEKEDLMQARIGLILATKVALANTLRLLGISAPEKM